MRSRTMLLTLCTTALMSGCATAGSGVAAEGAGEEASRSQRGNANLLVRADLENAVESNLYDLIRSRRPQWLQANRGVTSTAGGPSPLIVYMDDTRLGEVESLRSVQLGAVQSVRYLTATAATGRFGPGHMGGAIIISSQLRN